MKQQTAVEFLEQKFMSIFMTADGFKKVIAEAMAMEKEQMCNHFREGYMFANSPMLSIDENGKIIQSTMNYAELYYNKTYNKN